MYSELGTTPDAIKTAEKLKVEWSQTEPPFPEQASLYDHIRKAPVRKREVARETGSVDAAFASGAKVIEAEYEWPFQSHASMGPACALVEIKDGQVTCWSGTQKAHFVQQGLAATLGVPEEKVRVICAPRRARTSPATRSPAAAFTVAHDCGQIINPDGLTKCIEGNIVQGVSRTARAVLAGAREGRVELS